MNNDMVCLRKVCGYSWASRNLNPLSCPRCRHYKITRLAEQSRQGQPDTITIRGVEPQAQEQSKNIILPQVENKPKQTVKFEDDDFDNPKEIIRIRRPE